MPLVNARRKFAKMLRNWPNTVQLEKVGAFFYWIIGYFSRFHGFTARKTNAHSSFGAVAAPKGGGGGENSYFGMSTV
jgi:hypothetical protein